MRETLRSLSHNEKITFLSSIRKASYDEPVFFEFFRNEKSRELAIEVARETPQVLTFINMVGYDLLMDVCKKKFDEDVIRTLLDLGCGLNHTDANGKSTLEHIIDYDTSNERGLIVDCVQKGAEVNHHLPFMLPQENPRKFRQNWESKNRDWMDKSEKKLVAADMNKVLFRKPEFERFNARNPNLTPEEQALAFEKVHKAFPTVFTGLCLLGDPELISKILPYANEESLMKAVQYTATISADEILEVLVQDSRIKSLEIDDSERLLENAFCKGNLKTAQLLLQVRDFDWSIFPHG